MTDHFLEPEYQSWQMDLSVPDIPNEGPTHTFDTISKAVDDWIQRIYKVSSSKYVLFPGVLNETDKYDPLRKGVPTMRLREVLARQKEHGNSLRSWLHDREIEAGKRAKIEAAERRSQSRGTDRVPQHLKDLDNNFVVNYLARIPIVEHFDVNRMTRRRSSKVYRDERGRATRHMRPGTNTPYYSQERLEKKSRAKTRR